MLHVHSFLYIDLPHRLDAIDNISTKVDLLKYCHDNGIKVGL